MGQHFFNRNLGLSFFENVFKRKNDEGFGAQTSGIEKIIGGLQL